MKRTTPIPKRRAKPRRTTMLRCPEYREFLRVEGMCAACVRQLDSSEKIVTKAILHGLTAMFGRIDPCHTENGGMGMKGPDSSCAPLCRIHHEEYDSGRKAFELKYGLDMQAVAKAWWDLFQRSQA